jgi:hypothetical protein
MSSVYRLPLLNFLLTDASALASAQSTARSRAPSFVLVSNSATTITQAQIVKLAGTTRATVSQWRTQHADFPGPVNGDSHRFNLEDVLGWLDGQHIRADRRAPDEAADATYGDRVRRRLLPADRSDAGSPLRSLLALGPHVRGDAPHSDYLYLLFCLAYLRLYDEERWVQVSKSVPSSGDPGDARRLLQRVVAVVDRSLGCPELLRSAGAPPTRLRPLAFQPVSKVMELAAHLLPSDFRQLHADLAQEVCATGDAFYAGQRHPDHGGTAARRHCARRDQTARPAQSLRRAPG